MADITEPQKTQSIYDIFDEGEDFKVLLEPATNNPEGKKSGDWSVYVIERKAPSKRHPQGDPLPYEMAYKIYEQRVQHFRGKKSRQD
jgi:hypothetical protein